MSKLIYTSILVFIISVGNMLFAQEYEIGLQENPTLVNHLKTYPGALEKSSRGSIVLSVPFIDDFSSYQIYPADTCWEENDVFINNGYPLNPPSIGVATFDAISELGTLHSGAGSSQFLADELTSLPFNLGGFSNADSLFFSFAYQPQGKGDAPETSDSLVLEFYAPKSDTWHWQWSTTGSLVHSFKSVILPVSDSTLFYQNGFKFRFKNYASLTGLFEASWASNADQWHIDYVYLDTGRTSTDTVITDLAFLYGPSSFLKDYTAAPWSHFKNDQNYPLMADTFYFSFSNNRSIDDTISIIREVEVHDLIDGGTPIELYGGGGASNNFAAGDTTITFKNLSYTFNTSSNDRAEFYIQAYIKPGAIVEDFSQSNDTAGHHQVLDNYYAYDDGTPESGYGLGGEGAQNAMLAYQFINYKTDDSLRAIDMYFNRTVGDASQNYFYLRIWSHNANLNQPDDLLYNKIGITPEYHDSLFMFHRYSLQGSQGQDTAILVPDTFYVGWKQTTTDLLNIGFDKNNLVRPAGSGAWVNPRIKYNVTGSWQSSALSGALMMRPVFSQEALVGIEENSQSLSEINVYPNPSTGTFNIETPSPLSENLTFEVFSSTGQRVSSGIIDASNSQIDMNGFPIGMYFLRVCTPSEIIGHKKLILNK